MSDVTSYTELIRAIDASRVEMQVRHLDFDVLASFPKGLTGKAFGPSQVKRLGPEKLFDALRAAGLRLKVEIDPDQRDKMLKRIAEKFNPMQTNQARFENHASPVSTQLLSRCFKHLSRKGNAKRWAGKSKKERSAHARMMAMARVKKDRKARRIAQQRRQRDRQKIPAERAVTSPL